MTLAIQILFDNWPVFTFILVLLVLFLAWLTWKAHVSKVTTGNEGLLGQEGIYKGNNLVQVHGELWKVASDHNLSAGDIVEVTGIEKLRITVVKRP